MIAHVVIYFISISILAKALECEKEESCEIMDQTTEVPCIWEDDGWKVDQLKVWLQSDIMKRVHSGNVAEFATCAGREIIVDDPDLCIYRITSWNFETALESPVTNRSVLACSRLSV